MKKLIQKWFPIDQTTERFKQLKIPKNYLTFLQDFVVDDRFSLMTFNLHDAIDDLDLHTEILIRNYLVEQGYSKFDLNYRVSLDLVHTLKENLKENLTKLFESIVDEGVDKDEFDAFLKKEEYGFKGKTRKIQSYSIFLYLTKMRVYDRLIIDSIPLDYWKTLVTNTIQKYTAE